MEGELQVVGGGDLRTLRAIQCYDLSASLLHRGTFKSLKQRCRHLFRGLNCSSPGRLLKEKLDHEQLHATFSIWMQTSLRQLAYYAIKLSCPASPLSALTTCSSARCRIF